MRGRAPDEAGDRSDGWPHERKIVEVDEPFKEPARGNNWLVTAVLLSSGVLRHAADVPLLEGTMVVKQPEK